MRTSDKHTEREEREEDTSNQIEKLSSQVQDVRREQQYTRIMLGILLCICLIGNIYCITPSATQVNQWREEVSKNNQTRHYILPDAAATITANEVYNAEDLTMDMEASSTLTHPDKLIMDGVYYLEKVMKREEEECTTQKWLQNKAQDTAHDTVHQFLPVNGAISDK